MKRTEEADRNVRAGVLGGNPDCKKVSRWEKEEAQNSKIAVCEGSLARDGILVGDEEACWHPVTKRKNKKIAARSKWWSCEEEEDKTSAQNDVLRELAQIRAQCGFASKKRRTGGRMVLWKRRPGVCFELRMKRGDRCSGESSAVCAPGIPESGLIGLWWCWSLFLLLSLYLLNTLPGCSGEYSDMLKEFDHDMHQVQQMYEH